MSSGSPTTSSPHVLTTIGDGLNIDDLPPRAGLLQKSEDIVRGKFPASSRSSGTAALRTIKIFLASSSELEHDRNAFDLYFRTENDRLIQDGIYLTIERWENFLDAMSETTLQNEYNNAVRNCDIFVSLFMTKTGKFTEEEFEVAHEEFKNKNKPLIYTYFKDVPVTIGSITEEIVTLLNFKNKLSRLGHYYTSYTSIEDLQLQFRRQLDRLIKDNRV